MRSRGKLLGSVQCGFVMVLLRCDAFLVLRVGLLGLEWLRRIMFIVVELIFKSFGVS